MKLKPLVWTSLLSFAFTVPGIAADWTAQMGQLQSSNLGLDCFYFTLSGVPVADPALGNNNSWFAIPRTQYGAKDAYAMLMTAKVTGTAVRVTTTGSTIC